MVRDMKTNSPPNGKIRWAICFIPQVASQFVENKVPYIFKWTNLPAFGIISIRNQRSILFFFFFVRLAGIMGLLLSIRLVGIAGHVLGIG